MKLINLLYENEYKARGGKSILFEFEKDIEPENRGWVVHKLNAYLKFEHPKFEDSKTKAGFINISYIPSEEWKSRYTGKFGFVNWMSKISKGCSISLSRNKNEIDAANYALSKKFDPLNDWIANNKDEYESLSRKEKEDLYQDYLGKAKNRCMDEYEFDRNFHVDKPLVDYIRVKDKHRRKGVGFALYKKAAKLLADKYDFSLYASGVQSEYAKKAWEKLREELPVKKETLSKPDGGTKIRYKIDYN